MGKKYEAVEMAERKDFEEDLLSEETDIQDSSDEEEESSGYEEKKLTLAQACGLNTMNMFGTGPFITIPFVVAAADPPGPQALIGYALAAFACMNDSLIWAELGSMWPDSGGSYVYLREMYGRNTYGRLMAFLFVWQIMISGPMECASGFIATAQYIAYIDMNYSYAHHAGIGCLMCLATVYALYREIDEVGTITLVLWAFTICAILFAVVAGYSAFQKEFIETPAGAFNDPSKFFISLGVAARYAVYDFTGYYDVNFVGKEVQNPRKTIPVACIATCCVVAMTFFLVDVAIIGSLEWRPEHGGYVNLVLSGDDSANYIMSLFCETVVGRNFAIFFTLIVAITIFGSCFSFMIGLAQIPYTAAKDGYFYAFLAHEHETYRGLSDYSLLFVGGISCIFCFLDLGVVIEGMLTMQLLIQFMAQGFGLMYYRYLVNQEDQEVAGFSVPLFPIPNLIQLVIFGFIFATTDTYVFHGNAPLLEVAMVFLLSGVVMYMLWAKKNAFWPYESEEFESDDEIELDDMAIYVAGANFEDEMDILKKRLKSKAADLRRLEDLSTNSAQWYCDRNEGLKSAEGAVCSKQHRIVMLSQKLKKQEQRLARLETKVKEEEQALISEHERNLELANQLHELQARFGITGKGDEAFEGSETEESELEIGSANSWKTTDVVSWWRANLPRGAQEAIHVIESIHLNGKDLLELDRDMLLELGVKKILIAKVLRQIDDLRESSGIISDLREIALLDRVNPQSQAALKSQLAEKFAVSKLHNQQEDAERRELDELRSRDLVNKESIANLEKKMKVRTLPRHQSVDI